MLDGFCLTRKSLRSPRIDRAFDTSATPVQHVRVGHRGPHILVAEKLLHGPNIPGKGQVIAALTLADFFTHLQTV